MGGAFSHNASSNWSTAVNTMSATYGQETSSNTNLWNLATFENGCTFSGTIDQSIKSSTKSYTGQSVKNSFKNTTKMKAITKALSTAEVSGLNLGSLAISDIEATINTMVQNSVAIQVSQNCSSSTNAINSVKCGTGSNITEGAKIKQSINSDSLSMCLSKSSANSSSASSLSNMLDIKSSSLAKGIDPTAFLIIIILIIIAVVAAFAMAAGLPMKLLGLVRGKGSKVTSSTELKGGGLDAGRTLIYTSLGMLVLWILLGWIIGATGAGLWNLWPFGFQELMDIHDAREILLKMKMDTQKDELKRQLKKQHDIQQTLTTNVKRPGFWGSMSSIMGDPTDMFTPAAKLSTCNLPACTADQPPPCMRPGDKETCEGLDTIITATLSGITGRITTIDGDKVAVAFEGPGAIYNHIIPNNINKQGFTVGGITGTITSMDSIVSGVPGTTNVKTELHLTLDKTPDANLKGSSFTIHNGFYDQVDKIIKALGDKEDKLTSRPAYWAPSAGWLGVTFIILGAGICVTLKNSGVSMSLLRRINRIFAPFEKT